MNIGLIEKWHERIHPVDDKKLARWLENQNMRCISFSEVTYDYPEVAYDYQEFIYNMRRLLENFYLFNPHGYPTREWFYFKPRLAVFRIFYHENLSIACDKTYLLSNIQKKWKKYYTNLQKRKRIAKKPRSIIYREIYGRFPKN